MYNDIISHLPYKSSFLFVDNISSINEGEVIGDYTLKKDAFFYEDHFPGNPVTPGVILTEIMAQIGLVVLGIFLVSGSGPDLKSGSAAKVMPLLTETDVSFYKMVLPGEKVTVTSRKEYFRFGKLKCRMEMHNQGSQLVAKGLFSGMIKKYG